MKNLSKTFLTVVAVGLLSGGLFCQQAQATFITGRLALSGNANLDSTDFTTATEVTSFSGPFDVKSASGSFSSIPTGSAATINMASSWIFSPSMAVMPLWQVSFGGVSFTFDFTKVTGVNPVIIGGQPFLNIAGEGTVSGTGFAPTKATWNFTLVGPGGNPFPFVGLTIASGAAAPDGGATAALLGLALAGIEVIRRKFKAA
jgi:hypothetical protein